MTFDTTYILSLLNGARDILNPLVGIIIALALVLFLWNLAKFMRTQAEEERRRARNSMVWGIVILVVMVSVWGLVKIAQNTIGVTGNETVTTPVLPQ